MRFELDVLDVETILRRRHRVAVFQRHREQRGLLSGAVNHLVWNLNGLLPPTSTNKRFISAHPDAPSFTSPAEHHSTTAAHIV